MTAVVTEKLTPTQKAIAQKMQEIEHLRISGLTKDIEDVLANKKHTREELAVVCRAYVQDFDKSVRQSNIQKARKTHADKVASPA